MPSSSLPRVSFQKTKESIPEENFNKISEFFRVLGTKEILDGQLLSSVSLVTGVATLVPHKLGRKANGYIVVLRSTDALVWDDEANSSVKDTYLTMGTSKNVVVSLWVF